MDQLGIVFFGTPEFALPCLQELIDRGERIQAVVTQPDRPVGRGLQVKFSPVKQLALKHALKVLQPERVRAPEFLEQFRQLGADLAVVVAFGQIFPQALLEIPRSGFINVHSSLLPAYRGAAPINRAIINGDALTGITIMQLDAGMDTGAIIVQEPEPILPDDTAQSLHDRLARLGGQLLGVSLDRLRQGLWKAVAQDEQLATYAPIMKKEDGLIDWTLDARSLFNRIRGLTPWPGCFTFFEGKLLKIHRAAARDRQQESCPGTIISADARGIEVSAGCGSILITEVQLEGKKRMSAGDFLKGSPVLAGTRLGKN